jgi:hypothetical protein
MFTKRLPLALTVAFVAVLMASAEERKDTTAKDPAGGMYTYSGTISRVDADKRTIDLREARRGPGAEKDAGTKVSETRSSGTMTFHLADKAQVTLDGKPTTLASLKVGQFARVHTTGTAATLRADRVDASSRPVDPKGTAGEKDKDR